MHMHLQKENQSGRKKGFRLATLTTDVTEVLRAINTNVAWKNTSGKLTKTVQVKPPRQHPKKQVMTEDDIDKLFTNEKTVLSRAPLSNSPLPLNHKLNVLSQFKKQKNRVETGETKDNTLVRERADTHVDGRMDLRMNTHVDGRDGRMNTHVDLNGGQRFDTLIASQPSSTLENARSRKQVASKFTRHVKDFANSVKFLKLEDENDKLLSGMVGTLPNALDQLGISALFQGESNDTDDLTTKFKRDYMVGKIVGEGAYASVRVAVYRPLTLKVAIKVYEKSKIREPQRKRSVRREIRILQMLEHPNIVRIHDVVETNNHLNIVMEYLSGIALNSYLKCQAGHRANEKNCRSIVKGLVDALKYLHERRISHRDIKLENVILDDDLAPKLIDFGFSTCLEKEKKVKIFCGTPSYMAPEIVQKREYHGEPADIWALGVLAFVTATGLFPFKGATDQELYKKINTADYPRNELYFSKELADLISKMLRVDPEERLTAEEVLAHCWMRGEPDKRKEVSECKKRATISSHKSKERETRKLTETCHQNLKLQLRVIRQSPVNLNSTCTQRKMQGIQKSREKNGNSGNELQSKKDIFGKTNSKVLQLLKMGLKRKQEDKSKSKTRRA